MKKLLLISLLLLVTLHLFAQAPQQFSFQGVARDAAGKVITNTTVSLRLTIHETLPSGVNVYQETHKPLTSNGGIFTVSVGTGNDKNGSISDIKWSTGSFFLQVELDVTGGTNYIDLGATQLLSVPYALHAEEASHWKHNEPIVQTGIISASTLNAIGTGSVLLWHPQKAAFRAGFHLDNSWEDANIGEGSFASGGATTASGAFATVFGFSSIASGERSFSSGSATKAFGNYSVALGSGSKAIGMASAALGEGTSVKANGGMAIGRFNDQSDVVPVVPIGGIPVLTDRIFQIGNGIGDSERSNAFTILRNGKTGIGSNVLLPEFILDIGGRPRVRHNTGSTAGVYFDNSENKAEAFVGMKNDNQIGFFNANKWLFFVTELGNAHISGSTYNTSDRDLKRDFSSLSSSLTKLSELNGYHYFWKDITLDQTVQTGLIAQEVETLFPELVKTDDKGFKSVNYIGFIPHLIESVKELKASVEYLQTLNASIKAQNEELKAQASEMDSFRKELKALQAASKVETASSNTKLSEK